MPAHKKTTSDASSPDNYAIADQFTLFAKLMDIHGENAFKAKSYAAAAFAIEKTAVPLSGLQEQELFALKGIGESTGRKILEITQTGELKVLQDLLQKTPEGVLQMMNIKGLGPKKINTIWKEMQIDSIAGLEAACRENRIAAKKGFGEKTEQKILEAIEFVKGSEGQFLYKQVEDFTLALQEKLEAKFPDQKTVVTGEFRRQLPVISKLEWVTTIPIDELKNFLVNNEASVERVSTGMLVLKAAQQLLLVFHLTDVQHFTEKLFETSSSEQFLAAWRSGYNVIGDSEEQIFSAAKLAYIPPYLREEAAIIERASRGDFDDVVTTGTIKGLIHAHSNWSDGGHTIEEMVQALIARGFEYLVISDHSKAAFYANGLSEERARQQHAYIDELNSRYAPFKIFKSIECDILADGSLDYDDKTLSLFDLVITSVHSNLDMEEDKAMRRLMGAITNPYTTILGHMTGRLLLKRKGYPIDHEKIIAACVQHKVVIEINAAPVRLDIDWTWISYALQEGLLLSINPDAHTIEDFEYLKYGTLVAQKGALPARRNLSSFSLSEFESYLAETRKNKGLVSGAPN